MNGRWLLAIVTAGAVAAPAFPCFAASSPPVLAERSALRITDTLSITVTGLPDSAAADIVVSGPNGVTRAVKASAVLTDLEPGEYTITAAKVTFFGFTLIARIPTQVVQLAAGSSMSVQVAYGPAPSPQFPIAALSGGFQTRKMTVMGATYQYQLFVPRGYTPTRAWPVILSLHGSGERGSDNQVQLTVGLGAYLREHSLTFPAIVVLPQIPRTGTDGSGATPTATRMDSIAITALDQTLAEVHADSTRIYITGISMGAIRSWDIAYLRPGFFAASLPIAGGLCGLCLTKDRGTSELQGDSLAARRLAELPVWVFHGSDDQNSLVARDRTLVSVFRAMGSKIKYTEYPGMAHDVWTITYDDSAVWAWLFAQHR